MKDAKLRDSVSKIFKSLLLGTAARFEDDSNGEFLPNRLQQKSWTTQEKTQETGFPFRDSRILEKLSSNDPTSYILMYAIAGLSHILSFPKCLPLREISRCPICGFSPPKMLFVAAGIRSRFLEPNRPGKSSRPNRPWARQGRRHFIIASSISCRQETLAPSGATLPQAH